MCLLPTLKEQQLKGTFQYFSGSCCVWLSDVAIWFSNGSTFTIYSVTLVTTETTQKDKGSLISEDVVFVLSCMGKYKAYIIIIVKKKTSIIYINCQNVLSIREATSRLSGSIMRSVPT